MASKWWKRDVTPVSIFACFLRHEALSLLAAEFCNEVKGAELELPMLLVKSKLNPKSTMWFPECSVLGNLKTLSLQNIAKWWAGGGGRPTNTFLRALPSYQKVRKLSRGQNEEGEPVLSVCCAPVNALRGVASLTF